MGCGGATDDVKRGTASQNVYTYEILHTWFIVILFFSAAYSVQANHRSECIPVKLDLHCIEAGGHMRHITGR